MTGLRPPSVYRVPAARLVDRVQSGAAVPRFAFNTCRALLRPAFRLRPKLADGILVVATAA